MIRYILSLVVRWLINSLGLYIAIALISRLEHLPAHTAPHSIGVVLVAGLIFSIVNSIVRPIAIIVSLPAILLTLGLFTFLVNGFIVWISLLLVPRLSLGFWNSVLAGIILGIINYVVSSLIEFRASTVEKRATNGKQSAVKS